MRRMPLFAALCLYSSSMLAQQCPTPGPSNWCSGLYQYDGMGNIKFIGADAYTYDELGRLVKGTADVQRTGVYSRQDYTYDPFGNRTDVSRAQGSVGCAGGCEVPVTVSSSTNHISSNSALYDDAGNLTYIQTTVGSTSYPAAYTYDGAGSLVRANASDDRQFIYTADDERIAAKNGVTWTWTLRGLDNKVLREYTSMEVNNLPTANLTWVKDYVWRDGLLLAAVSPTAPGSSTTTVQHYHLDHLGTPRVVTNAAGAVIGVHSYYPFGAELQLSPMEPNAEALKFTGHERDTLPGGPLSLDYMHARYETGTLGRFLSVDVHPGSPSDGQSWNRYAYARNNPIRAIDPDGLKEVEFTIRHFIPAALANLPHGRNVGDGRSFSLDPGASVRTERTVTIETDPGRNAGGLVSTGVRIGGSFNTTTGLGGVASGDSLKVFVGRFAGFGNTAVIQTSQNEAEPVMASFGLPQIAQTMTGGLLGGIRSDLQILAGDDRITISGTRSSFPAMEVNVTVDGQTFAAYRGNADTSTVFGKQGFSIFKTESINRTCEPNDTGTWGCR